LFANREDWDDRVPTVLWAYRTTTKKLHKYTPFQLVYGKEVVVPAEFITPSLYIAQITHMSEDESVAQRLMELQELEETRFLADFHQSVEKARQKSWHDRHIKTKVFCKETRSYFMTVDTRNIQASCACIGWDHL
jgi:hypothetical protein